MSKLIKPSEESRYFIGGDGRPWEVDKDDESLLDRLTAEGSEYKEVTAAEYVAVADPEGLIFEQPKATVGKPRGRKKTVEQVDETLTEEEL